MFSSPAVGELRAAQSDPRSAAHLCHRHGTWQRLAAYLMVIALAAPGRAATPPPLPACGTRSLPPATWDHVVWIWFENHGLSQVVGSRDAPHINRRIIPGC